MSLELASIHIHPVKSLGGFAVEEAQLTDRGLEHDRRWMLVDEQGSFMTQRELASMACLHCSPLRNGFRVTDVRDGSTLDLPWALVEGERHKVSVWSDSLSALHGDAAWDSWFSAHLERPVRLVYMPDSSERRSDEGNAKGLTSLSDAFPYLITSQASLDDLNARLPSPIGMERFRPNLVVAGGTPFQEDVWTEITIGKVRFQLARPCARCVVITTDQLSGERSKEPLRTLATYRSAGNKVMFGMNAVGDADGCVRVGDLVHA
ncbi:MAG: MOSC N-terminal beta barrel domain-containing protein [Flavobacteriales bacterium]